PTPPPPRQLQRELWQRLAETERGQRRSHRFRMALTATVLSVVIILALVLSTSIGLQRSQPPRILESRPAAGVTQLWPIYQPIEIVFSKPMNEESVIQNLRISPPGERERLPISWEGTKLIIGADSERRVALLPDTVYQIAILPDAEDRWGPRLGLTYTLTFHTASAIMHTTETPVPTPVAPQPSLSPTPVASAIAEPSPTPQTTSTPVPSQSPLTPAPSSNSSHPSVPSPPAPSPLPTPSPVASPTPTPLPTPTPVLPTPAPEPTPTPAPSPTPATPEPIPVTGAFGRIYWAVEAVQQKLGAPVSPAFVVNAAELAFQRGLMVERFDTLTVYVLTATGTWK
ncbi:MAG: Ig-like domain-containing protein, partial [Thermomicrobium sp.]